VKRKKKEQKPVRASQKDNVDTKMFGSEKTQLDMAIKTVTTKKSTAGLGRSYCGNKNQKRGSLKKEEREGGSM